MKTHCPTSCKGRLKYAVTIEEAASIGETATQVNEIASENGWNIPPAAVVERPVSISRMHSAKSLAFHRFCYRG